MPAGRSFATQKVIQDHGRSDHLRRRRDRQTRQNDSSTTPYACTLKRDNRSAPQTT